MPASLGTATPRPTGPKPLFYGWDNPESSWLRTHPATAERIHRLLKLAPAASASPPWLASDGTISGFAVVPITRPPRWRFGDLWH